MIDPAALKAELAADPLGLGYAALRAIGNDTGLAAVLNAKAYRGPVPIRDLSSECLQLGLTGALLALAEVPVGGTISAGPPAVTMTLATKGLLHQMLTLIQTDYRLETADVDDPQFGPGCDALVALGVLASGGKAALMALGADRQSRAEVLWGTGAVVSAADVARTRSLT